CGGGLVLAWFVGALRRGRRWMAPRQTEGAMPHHVSLRSGDHSRCTIVPTPPAFADYIAGYLLRHDVIHE
ncbi:hypothetical protein, partial [Burkholderia cenocepacia]|uniref:hypothetical protein n=1 Tax=Burkholderia cenocepacia TaxID=95486 RepID=UPI002DDD719A